MHNLLTLIVISTSLYALKCTMYLSWYWWINQRFDQSDCETFYSYHRQLYLWANSNCFFFLCDFPNKTPKTYQNMLIGYKFYLYKVVLYKRNHIQHIISGNNTVQTKYKKVAKCIRSYLHHNDRKVTRKKYFHSKYQDIRWGHKWCHKAVTIHSLPKMTWYGSFWDTKS